MWHWLTKHLCTCDHNVSLWRWLVGGHGSHCPMRKRGIKGTHRNHRGY